MKNVEYTRISCVYMHLRHHAYHVNVMIPKLLIVRYRNISSDDEESHRSEEDCHTKSHDKKVQSSCYDAVLGETFYRKNETANST